MPVNPQVEPARPSPLQKPPPSIPPDADRPAPLLFDAVHRPIANPEHWERRRAELVEAWGAFLGVIGPERGEAPRAEVIEEDRVEAEGEGESAVVRALIRYEAEPGRVVEAYRLRPEGGANDGGRPGAVVLHSTTEITIRQPSGLEGPPEKHIGLHLARRGFVCVCPRCFLWEGVEPGEYAEAVERSRGRHPDASGTAQMLFDAQRALDLLEAESDVDGGRIAAIGHSLGGKEVLFLAAFDERVRAAVSSEGGIGIGYSNWDAPWYHSPAVGRPGFPLDHAQVLALVAPRAFLLIGGDSADGDRSWPYIEACLPVWELLGAPEWLGLFNHHQGHAYPPEAQATADAWLDRWLG